MRPFLQKISSFWIRRSCAAATIRPSWADRWQLPQRLRESRTIPLLLPDWRRLPCAGGREVLQAFCQPPLQPWPAQHRLLARHRPASRPPSLAWPRGVAFWAFRERRRRRRQDQVPHSPRRQRREPGPDASPQQPLAPVLARRRSGRCFRRLRRPCGYACRHAFRAAAFWPALPRSFLWKRQAAAMSSDVSASDDCSSEASPCVASLLSA